jgi:DNA-binding NtrC family response regulator
MTLSRILVVDDDDAIRTVVGEALRRAGHDVAFAETAAEQEALLTSYKPDLLITDVVLPDGDGLDLVPSILARFPGLPVIVISAQNTLSTAVRATEKGAFEYLPKPFDLDDLCGAVTEGLARRGNAQLGAPKESDEGSLPLVGRSASMQDVYRPPSPANSSKPSCLGMNAARLQVPLRALRADLNRPRGEHCSLMKLATCQWKRRRGCCAFSNRANSPLWAAIA